MTRPEPQRSATAPAKGCATPHSRFCSASAKPKTPRPQSRSLLIGTMKMPKLVRTPNDRISTTTPASNMTAGVRQDRRSVMQIASLSRCATGRRAPPHPTCPAADWK